MHKNNSFGEIWNELKKCKNVVMTLHHSPDGDSVGSCTAMKYVLERDLNCKVTLVSGDSVEENINSMSCVKDVQFGKDFSSMSLNTFDAVVCIDCSNEGMLSSAQKGVYKLPAGLKVIQIDHHATNLHFGTFNYVDASMPSACSILVEMFKELKIKFDAELSRRLLLGICTDTGFFAFDSNPLIALKQSVFLIEHGVDYYKEISKPIRMSESLSSKRLFATFINNIKVDEKRHFAYSSISKDEAKKLGLNSAELRGGIRAIQDLRGFDFVFTLTEVEDSVKGSFRTSTNVDVSLFAKALGGGGHKAASAFQLSSISLKDAEKKVLEVISDVGIHRY